MIYSWGAKTPGYIGWRLQVPVTHPRNNAKGKEEYPDQNEWRYFREYTAEDNRPVVLERDGQAVGINFGCHSAVLPHDISIVNRFAERASSKLKAYDYFRKANIRCPALIDPYTYDGDFFGRNDGYCGGKGMYCYTNGKKPTKRNKYEFYTAIIQTAVEFRVHVAFGKAIAGNIKEPRIPVDEMTERQRLVRSHDNGWSLVVKPLNAFSEYQLNLAVKAVDSLGLEFGAVDMVIDLFGDTHVLEVNSAPGMDFLAIKDAYVQAFTEELVPDKNGWRGKITNLVKRNK